MYKSNKKNNKAIHTVRIRLLGRAKIRTTDLYAGIHFFDDNTDNKTDAIERICRI